MTAVATDGCWDPKHVNTALLHAVTGRRSKEQYLVGMDCQYAAPIMMLVSGRASWLKGCCPLWLSSWGRLPPLLMGSLPSPVYSI